MATLAQRIKHILRPFKRIRKEISAVRSETAKFVGGFDSIAQAIAFERFYHNQTAHDYDFIDFSDNNFVLFDYPYHNVFASGNLGDEIQSIATKNALDSIYKSAKYEYFGRDYLAYYGGIAHKNTGGGGNRSQHIA